MRNMNVFLGIEEGKYDEYAIVPSSIDNVVMILANIIGEKTTKEVSNENYDTSGMELVNEEYISSYDSEEEHEVAYYTYLGTMYDDKSRILVAKIYEGDEEHDKGFEVSYLLKNIDIKEFKKIVDALSKLKVSSIEVTENLDSIVENGYEYANNPFETCRGFSPRISFKKEKGISNGINFVVLNFNKVYPYEITTQYNKNWTKMAFDRKPKVDDILTILKTI